MTLRQLDKELQSINAISDKLNHLVKYHLKIEGQLINESNGHKYNSKLSIYELVRRVSASHFPDRDHNPAFTFWFLKWNAKLYFEHNLLNDGLREQLASAMADDIIKLELEKIERDEGMARKYILDNHTDTHKHYRDKKGSLYLINAENLPLAKYEIIEIRRVLEGYYERHFTEHAYNAPTSPEVIAYAKHILLKDYLIKLLSEEVTTGPNKNYSKNWFQVGLLFATGEIQTLISEFSGNATHIAVYKFPKNPGGYRPYISESISNTTNSDKNIFNKPKKIDQIIVYCEDNEIEMTESFKALKSS